jgi:dihydropyrimidinase
MGIGFTEGVVRRGMSLQHFVDITSANAAKTMGLYPRKGAIAVGSDADLCVIDPSIKKKLTMADLHISNYSIWDGWEISGWPTTTILRGRVIVENGELFGSPEDGSRPYRKMDVKILNRPAC